MTRLVYSLPQGRNVPLADAIAVNSDMSLSLEDYYTGIQALFPIVLRRLTQPELSAMRRLKGWRPLGAMVGSSSLGFRHNLNTVADVPYGEPVPDSQLTGAAAPVSLWREAGTALFEDKPFSYSMADVIRRPAATLGYDSVIGSNIHTDYKLEKFWMERPVSSFIATAARYGKLSNHNPFWTTRFYNMRNVSLLQYQRWEMNHHAAQSEIPDQCPSYHLPPDCLTICCDWQFHVAGGRHPKDYLKIEGLPIRPDIQDLPKVLISHAPTWIL